MKKLLVSSLLLALCGIFFTSCTTVPRNETSTTTSNASTSRTYSK